MPYLGQTPTDVVIDGTITEDKIANNAVTNDKLADDAVDTAEIINDAVTTDKILDAAVTTAKIDDEAVTNAKIADGTIELAKHSAAVQTSLGLADSAFQTDDIASQAEAEAGVVTDKLMTPERTAQAITALYPDWTYEAAVVASGTSFDVSTTIPSGVTEVEILCTELNLSASLSLLVRIGPSAGVESADYVSSSMVSGTSVSSTTGFVVHNNNNTASGIIRFSKNEGGDEWFMSHSLGSNSGAIAGGGSKTIAGELVNITMQRNGASGTFSGTVRVRYK